MRNRIGQDIFAICESVFRQMIAIILYSAHNHFAPSNLRLDCTDLILAISQQRLCLYAMLSWFKCIFNGSLGSNHLVSIKINLLPVKRGITD